MLKHLSIAAIALGVLPTAAVAQQGPLDPYGRPYMMSPPQPSPGDPQYGARDMPAQAQTMPAQAAPMAPAYPQQARAPNDVGSTSRDEYGFLYNSRGDRIDRSGRILTPPVTPPGTPALR